jgi:hypothetical protein
MWKCNTCIHKNKQGNREEICEGSCRDVFKRLNKENHAYQEIIDKPSCCGKCPYLHKHPNEDYYMCTVYNWNHDDRERRYVTIRKNYLTKNTPEWCQLK